MRALDFLAQLPWALKRQPYGPNSLQVRSFLQRLPRLTPQEFQFVADSVWTYVDRSGQTWDDAAAMRQGEVPLGLQAYRSRWESAREAAWSAAAANHLGAPWNRLAHDVPARVGRLALWRGAQLASGLTYPYVADMSPERREAARASDALDFGMGFVRLAIAAGHGLLVRPFLPDAAFRALYHPFQTAIPVGSL